MIGFYFTLDLGVAPRYIVDLEVGSDIYFLTNIIIRG